jgi:hypothetical protein
VNDPATHPNFFLGEERYAARNGSIRVEVDGETFGRPRDQFAELVVRQMRAGYYRHDLFTLAASRETDSLYKIVMMFNPDPAVSGNALCSTSQPLPPVTLARTSLFAAFCRGPLAISETNGWVRLSGVEDPDFARLIDAVTLNLFPTADIRRQPL